MPLNKHDARAVGDQVWREVYVIAPTEAQIFNCFRSITFAANVTKGVQTLGTDGVVFKGFQRNLR